MLLWCFFFVERRCSFVIDNMLPGQYIRPLLSISTGGIVASRSVYKDFTSLVGNTPMVELRHASRVRMLQHTIDKEGFRVLEASEQSL